MDAIFGYDEFAHRIDEFADRIPSLLAKHNSTSDLSGSVSQLTDIADSPFTVAVVGQMRSGKSSLLNAIVGKDLAITGVNETTATINWFKWGQDNQCEEFRVTWKDDPAETFPLSDISKWTGDSEQAVRTRHIEFFANSPFLKIANIVDTPGTRSVLQDHTETVRDFLSLDTDKQSLTLGSNADAIIYVLMPVARQNDEEFLKEFEGSTRLPSTSPYNSIAVVHKWETLGDGSSQEIVQEKVERIAKSLGGLVTTVLPVSAPLAVASERYAKEFWESILDLAYNSTTGVVSELLLLEDDFIHYEIEGAALAADVRKEFRKQFPIPWPCLKVIIEQALKTQPATFLDLKHEIKSLSKIDELKSTLNDRFFARSSMIKFFSVLSKAITPCNIAIGRLRQERGKVSSLLHQAQSITENTQDSQDSLLEPFIKDVSQRLHEELAILDDISDALESQIVPLTDSFGDMQSDLLAIQTLDDTEEEIDLPVECLKRVCGAFGPNLEERIAEFTESASPITKVEELLGEVGRVRAGANRTARIALEHVTARLEQIADHFDSIHSQ
tara:strand:+ start:3050 stop:4720 length:1671 start_codon:yes stop_codon:yes gene_type:complete